MKFLPLAALAPLLLAGCGSLSSEVGDYSRAIPPGKGVVVIRVQTPVPLQDIDLTEASSGSQDSVLTDITAGQTTHVLLMPAGDYLWSKIDFPAAATAQGMETSWVDIPEEESKRYRFSVKPGVVNYPGDFVVKTWAPADKIITGLPIDMGVHEVPGTRYGFELIDRNGIAFSHLSPQQRDMAARTGMVYTGPGSDGFPEYYRSLPESSAPLVETPAPTPAIGGAIPLGTFFKTPVFGNVELSPDGKLGVGVTRPEGAGAEVTLVDLGAKTMSTVVQSIDPKEPFSYLHWASDDTAVFTTGLIAPKVATDLFSFCIIQFSRYKLSPRYRCCSAFMDR